MSGRTRGRGRGRGRGGSGGPKSASQQYLLSSAQEAGVDVRHLRGMAPAGAAIFPALEWHSSGERKLLAHESEELQNGKSAGEDAATGGAGDGSAESAGVKKEPGDTSDAPSAAPAPDAAAPKAPEKPRSPELIYLISKSREMHHRMQSSAFYVRTTKGVPDVARYSDRLRPPPNIDASAVLSHCLGGRKRTRGEGGGVFVPEELCGGQRRMPGSATTDGEGKKKAKGLSADELEAKIKHEGDVDDDGEEQKQEGGEEEEDVSVEEEEEESDDADYVTNYYESEGDESRGSDGEPTF
ncbi:hypothetical protein ACHAXT_011478 [Thalassiosira profunda]